jgi:hypothetical protein
MDPRVKPEDDNADKSFEKNRIRRFKERGVIIAHINKNSRTLTWVNTSN